MSAYKIRTIIDIVNSENDKIDYYLELFWIFTYFWRIKGIYFSYLDIFTIQIMKMALPLKPQFEAENAAKPNMTRRGFLRGFGNAAMGAAALGAVATTSLASLPFGNDAEAGEAQAATRATSPLKSRDEMANYSKDPNIKGVGVFINLQSDASLKDGEALGERLKSAFASRGVPMEFRLNKSRGTATDLTFYVQDYDFTVNVADLRSQLGEILAHHRDLWSPARPSLSALQN